MPSLIDFARIGAPAAIAALDYEAQLAAGRAKIAELLPDYDVAAIEADPANKILEAAAYLDLLTRARVNDGLKAGFLAYATGTDLDHLAANRGVTRLSGETDARLRDRVQQAFWAVAAGGPSGAYRWHALSAHADVIDAGVHSPAPGKVDVIVLARVWEAEPTAEQVRYGAALFPDDAPSATGAKPIRADHAQAPIAAVRAALNAEDVIPLTDTVSVLAVHLIEVPIHAVLTLYPGPDAELLMTDARAALDAYLRGIRRVGYDCTRAGLHDALVVPGVQNVALTSPAADVTCSPYQMTVSPDVVLSIAEARDV